MIQNAHPESANDDPGRPSLRLEREACLGRARPGAAQMLRAFEHLVAQQPGICLGAALSLGIALGWWVKRS